MANTEQAKAWDGEEGAHWAAHAERYDSGLREHSALLREVARIALDERVLDVGCGNGASTRDAARAAASGSATGLDLSSSMLARARATAAAEGLTNVEFVQGDAQVFEFEAAAFDITISRFGVMFFDDPIAAFTNIARALKPTGRLAMIVWQPLAQNEWLSTVRTAISVGRTLPTPQPGAPGPFGLSEPAYVQRVLGEAGFTDIALEPRDATFHAGTDADDAFAYTSGLGFTRLMVQDLDDGQRTAAFDALRALMVAHDTGHGVTFGSAVWLLTANRS